MRVLPEIDESIDLEVLDLGLAARLLLRCPGAAQITVEGNAVAELRTRLAGSVVPSPIDEAVIDSSDEESSAATFSLTEEVASAIEPLLALCDWSIFHVNLHTADEWLVEGYDWGEGCCPLRIAVAASSCAAALVEAGAARPWVSDD